MNRALLAGRLTRDPEMRTLASGKNITTFSLETEEALPQGGGLSREYHAIVVWDRLAEVCFEYLAKGSLVAVDGRIATRSWDDDRGARHWKTEVVASHVELLHGSRRVAYTAEVSGSPREEVSK